MYTIDLGGTNIRISKGSEVIHTSNFNGNIINNPNLGEQLIEILKEHQINSQLLIGIAGYYSCSQQLKDNLDLELAKHLTDFSVISDAEFHARSLISEHQLLVSLGTGSVGSYYHQQQFKIIGGYGHIIGDLGSGYHFGKLLIQNYLNDYEAGNNKDYMRLVEAYFKASGRAVLTIILNDEKNRCSQLSKQFMDNDHFEDIFLQYFEQFEIELRRMIAISGKQNVIINGAITNSKRFKHQIGNLNLNIIIK